MANERKPSDEDEHLELPLDEQFRQSEQYQFDFDEPEIDERKRIRQFRRLGLI